jgi:hypothetical protein
LLAADGDGGGGGGVSDSKLLAQAMAMKLAEKKRQEEMPFRTKVLVVRDFVRGYIGMSTLWWLVVIDGM